MVHWMTQALRMNVDEGLLGRELLEALQSAPKKAVSLVNRMPPQILGSAGIPPIPAVGFAGTPSGVRIALSRLDRLFRRELDDEESDALQKFYKCERTGKMVDYLHDHEETYEGAAIRADLFLSDSSKSWHLVNGAKLSSLQRFLLLSQVQGDLRKYEEIKFFMKKLLPFDKDSPLLGLAFADTPGLGSSGGDGGGVFAAWEPTPATSTHQTGDLSEAAWPSSSSSSLSWPSAAFSGNTGASGVDEGSLGAFSNQAGWVYWGQTAPPPGMNWEVSQVHEETGARLVEVPIWFQGRYSGDWWSQETGVLLATEEEHTEWEQAELAITNGEIDVSE